MNLASNFSYMAITDSLPNYGIIRGLKKSYG